MARRDPALNISNPRLIAAIYFGLLSVVGTILINAFLTTVIGIKEMIPVFQAILIGVIVASCTGALFGEHIVHCKKPYKQKAFSLGFIMVIASLPIFDLGLMICMILENSAFMPITGLKSILYFYLTLLFYSYLLFGFMLAIASGLAAMYLRSQLVYDILHTYNESPIEEQKLPVKVIKQPYHELHSDKK